MASQTKPPIMEQPAGMGMTWMPTPQLTDCPPGLEYLANIDQLIVKQSVELFEAVTGIDCKNRYTIANSMGQQVYFAYEGSHSDSRPFQCCAGCCWCISGQNCCAFRINIESPPGNPVGYVYQGCSGWKPKYHVHDDNMEEVLTIQGPCVPASVAVDVPEIFISGNDGEEIGAVTKVWNGVVKEMCTNADTFSLTFPKDLDVKQKATILGAMFLIEFMYYERATRLHRRWHKMLQRLSQPVKGQPCLLNIYSS
ncbi:putative phospholipid scramblase 1 [Apostichopus japonicus]|uniref:Phospholipid scramblase n=1 Tax=Stichopus japonicus TaxID=307972 RepID=A0A2G8LF58_STIJA|nr:putative phospholipid scramblase 1 [Apostichopus japonicus]